MTVGGLWLSHLQILHKTGLMPYNAKTTKSHDCLVGWSLTALSALEGYIVPCEK